MNSAGMFIAARLVTAVSASGIVPVALALVGDRVPYERRGRALGWLFGAMAGIAFGSTLGALAEPVIGWRGLFFVVAGLAAVVLAALVPRRDGLGGRPPSDAPRAKPRDVVAGYVRLLGLSRARRTYAYVLINAVLQSGVYTWLGVYLARRYHLGDVGIGLALLGYGVPGFLLGPLIGRVTRPPRSGDDPDRLGRGRSCCAAAGPARTGRGGGRGRNLVVARLRPHPAAAGRDRHPAAGQARPGHGVQRVHPLRPASGAWPSRASSTPPGSPSPWSSSA